MSFRLDIRLRHHLGPLADFFLDKGLHGFRRAAADIVTLLRELVAQLTVLQDDPLSGDLFVFKTRRGDKIKILAWMGDGFALYLRRLERGTFAFPTAKDAYAIVTPTQLAMILGGLDPAKVRERRRYKNSVVA